jgi:hypothetical protein
MNKLVHTSIDVAKKKREKLFLKQWNLDWFFTIQQVWDDEVAEIAQRWVDQCVVSVDRERSTREYRI